MPCQEQIQAQKSSFARVLHSFADESCKPSYYPGCLLTVLLMTARNMCTHWELAEGLGRKKSKPDSTSTQMSCKNEKDYEGKMGGRLHFLLILTSNTALRKRSGCLSAKTVSNCEIWAKQFLGYWPWSLLSICWKGFFRMFDFLARNYSEVSMKSGPCMCFHFLCGHGQTASKTEINVVWRKRAGNLWTGKKKITTVALNFSWHENCSNSKDSWALYCLV